MQNEGHEISNHGLTDALAARLPDLDLDIQTTERIITKALGEGTDQKEIVKWYRPGCGIFTRGMLATVAKLGYRLVLGNVYPYDPHVNSTYLNTRFIVNSNLQPGDIIILHQRPHSVETLVRVLDHARTKGLAVTTLSQLNSA